MKVIGFKEFAAMPAGTVFSYFVPMMCEGLYVKGDTICHHGKPADYFEESLVADCWNGDQPTVGDGGSRWGMFDYDLQYAIYEPEDVKNLVSMLGGIIPLTNDRVGV